jgi:3-phenylpropionate/trans-cinnamate dioxygenase ferredoxin subunit
MADIPADALPLGDLSGLRDGELRCFGDVGAHGIVVCRVGGRLYALDDNCSHADTPLSEGRLRGHSLVCPLHGAAFDVRDGSHSGPPAWEGVVAHEVVEGDDGAHVVVARRAPRPGPTSADGSHQRTR